ncbi:MAG: L-lactate permease [Planctomycetaceae bacterium]
MTWTQNYIPLADSLTLSTLAAAIPVVLLLGLLAFFHVRAHVAAIVGLSAALVVAIAVYGMPMRLAGLSAVYGAAYGLFPIGWIVLSAIFVYDITVQTGQFEVVKRTIASLADDRRVQALLIAFSFGAFIEGAAGFGTPVAISAAMLIGLGFRPLQAAGLALIGNTAPVAFGALGTPIITLAQVTGLDLHALSMMVGRQLPFFSLIVPFWIVAAMSGWRRTIEVWPACVTAGGSFAAVQFLVSNYHGPWLVDIAGAIVSILALVTLLRYWQPATVWRFDHESETDDAVNVEPPEPVTASDISPDVAEAIEPPATTPASTEPVSRREAWRAWTPWLVMSVVVFAWGVPQIKEALNDVSVVQIPIEGLHERVLRAPPVVVTPHPEKAVFALNWLSATGTGLLLSGIISGLLLGLRPVELLWTFGGTLARVRYSLLTIAAMLALGFTTRFAGLDSTLGLAFAETGPLFPFFSALLGWLGVALTGSDTSSNVLFGNLQKVTAEQLGISPVLAAASNSSGGVMGKMVDAQSIVVAGVATGRQGEEGRILRYVFFHSLALASLVGLLVLLQARVLTGMVPATEPTTVRVVEATSGD